MGLFKDPGFKMTKMFGLAPTGFRITGHKLQFLVITCVNFPPDRMSIDPDPD